jgi:septum formation protein
LNKTVFELILASASPRRRQLLSLLGLPFEVAVSDVDETLPHASAEESVIALALAKARSIAARHPHRPIIAADTVVAVDDRILGKPGDRAEAVAMLVSLRHRWHRVWTGLVLIGAEGGQPLSVAVPTDVFMRDYADAEIAAYVASGDPLDKAAAYAIQHATFRPVETIVGCHANVMGLPLCHLYALLAQGGVLPPVFPSAACPIHLGISCPPSGELWMPASG